MIARPFPSFGYRQASLAFLLLALAALLAADLHVTALHPWAELMRMLRGLARPDVLAVEGRALANTVAFALCGVALGGAAGFCLAVPFARSRAVRVLCASLRSVHELFWALLLMQVSGLAPSTGILAIALPYAGIFAKVFSEMIEEADLAALKTLPTGTSALSAFFFARIPDLVAPMRDYTLYRLECGLRSTLVLGFIGLPTIGFNLDSYFKQGRFRGRRGTALRLLSADRDATCLWARSWTVPVLLVISLYILPAGPAGGPVLENVARFLGHDIVPSPLRGADLATLAPWSALADWLRRILIGQIIPGMINTLVLSQVALLGMALLALFGFPLTCARFAGRFGRPFGRALLVVVRSTPEYMLAYVLLQIFGPSMLPAVVALSLHNGAVVAYLMGRKADALDYRADAPRRRIDLFAYEAVPRLYGQFLAYLLYRWEIILRESAIFGLLGVTTLGYYVDAAISELRLDVAVVLIVATALLSLCVDSLSRALRRALRIADLATRLSDTARAPISPRPA